MTFAHVARGFGGGALLSRCGKFALLVLQENNTREEEEERKHFNSLKSVHFARARCSTREWAHSFRWSARRRPFLISSQLVQSKAKPKAQVEPDSIHLSCERHE